VKISLIAQNDFLEIVGYLDILPPEEAVRGYDNIIKETKVLATAPESCSFARDSLLRLRGYRMLIVDNYMFFFVIIGSTVEIRRIIYARKQYDRLI
jgi:plasmid stabilization system protein ParE